jgi:hypothetical protein
VLVLSAPAGTMTEAPLVSVTVPPAAPMTAGGGGGGGLFDVGGGVALSSPPPQPANKLNTHRIKARPERMSLTPLLP